MSLLQQQLQQLQLERIETARSGIRKTLPSLIFGNDAKQVTIQQVYEISLTALRQLQAHSEIFKQFEETIFSPDTLTFDRDVSEPHIVKQIDQTISQYLRTLCGYYNLNSAIQSLEYLVRRFRIDIHHEAELFYTFLPFHDQEGFKLLVDGIRPKLLQDVSLSFPASRASLQQFIVQNHFEHLNQILKTLNKLNTQQSRTIYTRFAYTVIIELISLQGKGSDNLCGIALSQILNDLKTRKSEDSLLYILSCAIMIYNYYSYTIDAQFTDKLLFNVIHNQPALCKTDLLNFIFKIASFHEHFKISLKIAQILLQKQFFDDEQADTERADFVYACCVDSMFFLTSFKVAPHEQESKLQVVQQIINESAKFNRKITKTLTSAVKYLLRIYNNNIQLQLSDKVCQQLINTLNLIEETDGSTFTNGIQQYIKSGGDISIVQRIVQSKLTALLTSEISIVGQKSNYLQALESTNNSIRYEAYGHLEKLIQSTDQQQIDQQTLQQLMDYLFTKLYIETDLQIIKIILEIILLLAKKDIKSQNMNIIDSITVTTKRTLFTQSYDIYDIFKILAEVIAQLKITNLNIQNIIILLTIQLNLEQINIHNPVIEELNKLNTTLLENIEIINLNTLFNISNDELFLVFTTNQNSLHYKSLLVYYIIYNIDLYIMKFDYRLLNELFKYELVKQYFVQQYSQKLTQKEQMQYQNILNLKEDVLKLYLQKRITSIDLQQFIRQFVHQFCKVQQSNIEEPQQKIHQISINVHQQILVYHNVLLQLLKESQTISEEIMIQLMSTVYIYNKNNMYEQLQQIKQLISNKYTQSDNNKLDNNQVNSPELKELQQTKQSIDTKLQLDFFNEFKQNYDQQYIQQLDEVLLTINFGYLDTCQTYSVVQQLMQYLYQESSASNIVKTVIDILMILINDIQQLDSSSNQISNMYTIEFKQFIAEELHNLMLQRKHLDFQCDIMILDHLMLLNNIVFQESDQIDSSVQNEKHVQLVQIHMYVCLIILSSIDVYQLELSNVPYIVWVLSHIERFSNIKQNIYLTTIQKCSFFGQMQEAAKYYLNNICLDIENCQQLYTNNLEVFLDTFLQSKYIVNQQLLIKKLIQTLVEVADDIVMFKGLQLILKIILHNGIETYPTVNNSSKVPDEQQSNEQQLLSVEDSQVLISQVLQTYNERMVDQLLDNIIQFTPYISFNYFGNNFIPQIFDERTLSVAHVNLLADTILVRFSQDQCLKLLQILLYHATMSGIKTYNEQILLDYIYEILKNVINYIPEFLPGYIIFLLTQFDSQENINSVDLLLLFQKDQQIATLSVLLGYLFDVNDVMSYLNQENENYLGISVLDLFMANNEEIIDIVLQFVVLVLQSMQVDGDDNQQMQFKTTPPGSKSSIKTDVPVVFLYKVVLQLPENTQNISMQVQTLLTPAEIFGIAAQNKQQLMENTLFCNNYKMALAEFIQIQVQKQNSEQIDEKHQNINGFIKNLNEQFILHQFKTIASQHLLQVLLNTSAFMHNTITVDKIANQLLTSLNEQLIEQNQNENSEEDQELTQLIINNIGILIEKLGTRYIPHLQNIFKLLNKNGHYKGLSFKHRIYLYNNLAMYQGKFISSYINQIYHFILEIQDQKHQLELDSLYQSLSQYVQLRQLLQNVYNLCLSEEITKENTQQFINIINKIIISAITKQIKQFNSQQLKQIIQIAYELAYFNDLKIGLQLAFSIIYQAFHALIRIQITQNEMQTIINIVENQEFNKYGSILLTLLCNKAMTQIPDLKDSYVGNVNRQSELLFDFRRFNNVQSGEKKMKENQDASTQQSPFKEMQNLEAKTIQFGEQSFFRSNALHIQLFLALLSYLETLFTENIISHEKILQETFDIYISETYKYKIESNISFKEYGALNGFKQIGKHMTDSMLLQQPWVKQVKMMAENPQFLLEVVASLEGATQAQNTPENIKQALIGVLSEHLEIQEQKELSERCLQLLDKLTKIE